MMVSEYKSTSSDKQPPMPHDDPCDDWSGLPPPKPPPPKGQNMNRYYVEFDSNVMGGGCYLYIMAYSEDHVKDIFVAYNLVAIDQTD